jgi:periplasmic protein TonB
MKTNKAIQPSVAITLDDIIFSNRNQAYGAYYLRKKYNKHLLLALLLVLFMMGSGITVPFVWSYIFPKEPVITDTPPRPPIIYETAKTDEYKIPTPPKIDPSREIIRRTQFGVYVPVDSIQNNDTTRRLATVFDPPIALPGNDSFVVFVDTSNIIPPVEQVYTYVEESATFNKGTLKDFHDWVKKNIVYPSEASSIGLDGKVSLSFVVNKLGEVCDINIMRGVHPSINDETIRVLLNSPKWQPAKQNGHPVKQRFYLQVKYEIK